MHQESTRYTIAPQDRWRIACHRCLLHLSWHLWSRTFFPFLSTLDLAYSSQLIGKDYYRSTAYSFCYLRRLGQRDAPYLWPNPRKLQSTFRYDCCWLSRGPGQRHHHGSRISRGCFLMSIGWLRSCAVILFAIIIWISTPKFKIL